MDVTKVRIDHPKFEQILSISDNTYVVVFRVGQYVGPTPEALAAGKRISTILKQITDADLALYREWEGNVVQYAMNSKAINPEITDAVAQEFVDATKAAFPDAVIGHSWANEMHGLVGYSVRVHFKTEDTK